MNYEKALKSAIEQAAAIAEQHPDAVLIACDASEHDDEPGRIQTTFEMSTGHLFAVTFEPDEEHNLQDRQQLEMGFAWGIAITAELTAI